MEVPASSSRDYSSWEYVGQRPRRVPHEDTIDPDEPQIKQDILRMILQYLQDEGYTASSMTIQDETNVKLLEQVSQRAHVKRMRRAILDGDWLEVEKLCAKSGFAKSKSFLYAAYRAQYLELIEGQEYQKAFTHLTKRLKPLESHASSSADFKDLCYLLTCKSVQGVVRDWDGIISAREQQPDTLGRAPNPIPALARILALTPALTSWPPATGAHHTGAHQAREQLAEQHCSMREFELGAADLASNPKGAASRQQVPPRRLLGLLQQAVAYQIEFSHYHPTARANVQASSLLDDYSCALLPNAQRGVLRGHAAGVKCVEWVGGGGLLASGGNDHCVRLWSARDHSALAVMRGHESRVWQLAASADGRQLASASADGTVRVWGLGERGEAPPPADAAGLPASEVTPSATLSGHVGDVYSVSLHPSEAQLVSAGYDKTVRLHDLTKGVLVRTLHGHELAVSHVLFNAAGNLVVSAAKDATVRFWDLRSAVCLQSFGRPLGEVTSVQLSPSGTQLLSSSRDNAVRLWDVRSARPLRSFTGHQNTCKSFVRARFGPGKGLVVSGSEDGMVHIWDLESGQLMQRLRGHADVVYDAAWSEETSMLASCSHDGTLATWWYDPSKPLFAAEDPHMDAW